ncbi:MAG: zinc transporter ZupT [Desulfovibrionaceae bacterium]
MEVLSGNVAVALGLTLFAGLSTGIGSALAFFARTTNTRFLCVSLGFSAGVMLYVSFVEIFFQARAALTGALGDRLGNWATVLGFFGGMAAAALIDRLVPSGENPHEMHTVEDMRPSPAAMAACGGPVDEPGLAPDPGPDPAPGAPAPAVADAAAGLRPLYRMGLITAIAIGVHNFPEGLATFMASLSNPQLGVLIAVAIAIHNIPEGIAVSVPIYYATGDRKKAFIYSFTSGLAEPVGALVGYLVLMPVLTPVTFGVTFAGVAGIMVFICLDELLPAAERYGEHHLSIYGLVGGMAVMAVSLLLFL